MVRPKLYRAILLPLWMVFAIASSAQVERAVAEAQGIT